MIKCVIIDDEQPAIDVLENYIIRVPYLELIGSATNPIVGINLITTLNVELVFLDIQMDEMSGIDVMKVLGADVKVVLCTAFSEFAVKSYELNAVDYLMKPISFDRFATAIKKIKSDSNTSLIDEAKQIANDYIFVKTEQKGKMVKIDLDEIDFIEAMNNYIAFYRGNSKILVYSTMKEIESHLPTNKFLRIHKSYIIAIKKITGVDNNCITLKNRSEHIPISLSYKTAFMQVLSNKVLNGN